MLIQLAITGLLVAMLPLAIVWVSNDPDKYRKLVWVTLFFTFDLIVFGGFTRLTDSGLGCPDWPGCYGQADPWQAHAEISAAEAAMPTGPVTVTKAWIEMVHRYLAMGIGVLMISLAALAWRRRWRLTAGVEPLSPRLPTALLALVCLQGAFGAWTVTLKLQPVIVTTHLLLGMTLLALLTWHAAARSGHAPVAARASRLRPLAALGLGLLFAVVALGGWVSSNYAALACQDFPLCSGSAWPEVGFEDFAHGYALWRDLGHTAGGELLPFAALRAIHWTHRLAAYGLLAFLAYLALKARKIKGLEKTANLLLAALALQLATGAGSILLQLPLALAVAHNAGAALLIGLLSILNYKIATAPASSGQVLLEEGNRA